MGQRKQQQLFQPHLCHSKSLTFLIPIILFVLPILLYSSCANQAAISGGPKDSIPPTLLSTIPNNKSLNFRGDQIVLLFDERIQSPQIKTKLIITPTIDVNYKFIVKRNELRLIFDEPFGDSLTYTLNFADAVEDITEKNPARNVVLAFSTTYYIDSMAVSGKVYDLLTNEPTADAVVALYSENDTLDIFTGKPTYFALTDSAGDFFIENIKNGIYNVYSFVDENRNLTNEPTAEKQGFNLNPVELTLTNTDSIRIPLLLSDIRPLEISRSRPIGQYFEVRFNKYVHDYRVTPLDSNNQVPRNNLITDNEIIRFYPTITIADSIPYKLFATDSVGQIVNDTIYVRFLDDSRRPEELEINVAPTRDSEILEEFEVRFSFNKPVAQINTDSIAITYDSLRTDFFDSTFHVEWNFNQTVLTLSKKLDANFLPDTLAVLNEIKAREDSIRSLSPSPDTVQTKENAPLTVEEARRQAQAEKPVNPKAVQLVLGKGAFITIEDDSTEARIFNYLFKSPEDYGIIRGAINTSYTSYFVQLVNENYEVIKMHHIVGDTLSNHSYQFTYIPPGKYSLRVLIDGDNDGRWSPGNVMLKLPPEPIHFFNDFFDIRANWELEDVDLTF